MGERELKDSKEKCLNGRGLSYNKVLNPLKEPEKFNEADPGHLRPYLV